MYPQNGLAGNNAPSMNGIPAGSAFGPMSDSPFGGTVAPMTGSPVAGVPHIPATQGDDPSRVITSSLVRLSYAHLWEPKSVGGGTPKYGVSLIIPKSDISTLEAIRSTVQFAYEKGAEKLKGNGSTVPPLSAIKVPLRDGDTDRPQDPAYAGAFFVNAHSIDAPDIVDIHCHQITNRSEVYSGCYARVSITFYAYNVHGNRGIGCALNNVQKIADGAPLGGGRPRAESDFSTAPASSNGSYDFLG